MVNHCVILSSKRNSTAPVWGIWDNQDDIPPYHDKHGTNNADTTGRSSPLPSPNRASAETKGQYFKYLSSLYGERDAPQFLRTSSMTLLTCFNKFKSNGPWPEHRANTNQQLRPYGCKLYYFFTPFFLLSDCSVLLALIMFVSFDVFSFAHSVSLIYFSSLCYTTYVTLVV